MGSYDLLPTGDWRNQGWSLVGSGVTKLWHAVDDDDDATYIASPSHCGEATVKFPQNITSIPDGAVITSVTVFVRCAKIGSGHKHLTVSLFSYYDCARYYSRTIHPTTTPTTFEVATYKLDSLGHKWDVHRLNRLLLRARSYSRVSDGIRIYKFYVRVNYKVDPTVVIDQPSGTVYTASPTIAWTYDHADADAQKQAVYRIFTDQEKQKVSFHPAKSPPVFAKTVQGESFLDVVPTSLNPDKYWVYIQATSIYGAQSDWVGKPFTIESPAPGVPGNDNAGIAGTPGIGVPTVVPDGSDSSATLTFRDSSNLLSVQQADFEIVGDYLGFTGTNCTLARDTVEFFPPGVGSLKLTASTAATMSAQSSFIECAELTPVTVRCQFKSGSTSRTVNFYVRFFDVDFAQVGSDVTASGTDTSSTWTEVVATGSAPAGTAYAKVFAEVVTPASSEVHYIDHPGLMYGTGSAWTHGGHQSRNLLDAHLSTGDDPVYSNTWTAGNSGSTVTQVASAGTGADGVETNRMTYTGVTPSVAFRAAGTVFTSPTSGTDYTLNKPAGVADGDLLIAYVLSSGLGEINPPEGWTLVNASQVDDDNSKDVSLWVLKRNGLSIDPSSWAGTLETTSTRRSAVVLAYSGAAPAEEQFLADNVSGSPSGGLVQQTPAVTNTDTNAWRLSAFAVSDDVSGLTMTANKDAPVVTGISFVGKGTRWSKGTSTTSFTINRPSGVVTGDLMIAAVSGVGNLTFNAPAGWTLVRKTTNFAQVDVTTAIYKRTAGASEPTSWTGTITAGSWPVMTQSVAYRGAADATLQFVAENSSTRDSSDNITTATVSNTDSRSWRICVFTGSSFTGSYTANWTSSEAVERDDGQQAGSGATYAISTGVFDSNGQVSTGNHSRTGYLSENFYAGTAWIGLIKVDTSAPGQGVDESERVENTNGSASQYLTLAAYDSGGPVPAGQTRIYGELVPSSGTTVDSSAQWIGLMKPASAAPAGEAAARTVSTVEMFEIDPRVLELAGNKITVTATLLGSTSGTPYLALDFFRANQLMSTAVAQGRPFNSTVWTKSSATFDLPDGTTHIRPVVKAVDRAINDTVDFDRVGVMLGSSDVWHCGTSREAHPVWSIPVIQCADDDGTGYGDWADLKGQVLYPPQFDPSTGQTVYTDHTIIPLNLRKYRAQTVTYGLAGDVFASGWGPESSEVSFTSVNWWLKDISDPTLNMQIKVAGEPTSVGTTNTAAVFQPLGVTHPVVLTEGYKSDAVELTVICGGPPDYDKGEYPRLRKLLGSRKTLLLQSDVDDVWWVRPVGDLEAETQASALRKERPVRFVKVQFVQVAPEA